MEHFEAAPGSKVKEKSVYLLHLDTPRIIIISCVVIGIVVVSFLLGMNFLKSDSRNDIAHTSMMLDDGKFPDTAKAPLPGEGDSLAPLDRPPLADEKSTAGSDPIALAKKDSPDILNGENIKEIIPANDKKVPEATQIAEAMPVGKHKPVKHHGVSKKKTSSEKIASVDKKGHNKNSRRENKAVMEVSAPADLYNGGGSGFMIQVASYDNKPRAETEVKTLRTKKYDAFISDTSVSGKKYFRVRIGPLADRDRAIELLRDVQSEKRYEESYLVKE